MSEAENRLRRALALAVGHIDHLATALASRKDGYSFESLGEDMPEIRGALALSSQQSNTEAT